MIITVSWLVVVVVFKKLVLHFWFRNLGSVLNQSLWTNTLMCTAFLFTWKTTIQSKIIEKQTKIEKNKTQLKCRFKFLNLFTTHNKSNHHTSTLIVMKSVRLQLPLVNVIEHFKFNTKIKIKNLKFWKLKIKSTTNHQFGSWSWRQINKLH